MILQRVVNCEGKSGEKSCLFLKITTEDLRYLGAVIGSETFKQKYVQEKTSKFEYFECMLDNIRIENRILVQI